MSSIISAVGQQDAEGALARVILEGDLSKLTPEQKVVHYNATCQSMGLNPLTRPLEYLRLNGKELLYARKDCTDQLRTLRQVSVQIVDKVITDGLVVVTARATMPDGRSDEEIGAVPLGDIKGEARANAMMKAVTKAKRRVTLSICGLGFLDESELAGIPPEARRDTVAPARGPSIDAEPVREEAPAARTWAMIGPDGTTREAPSLRAWEMWSKAAIGRLLPDGFTAVAGWRDAMEDHITAVAVAGDIAAQQVRDAITDALDTLAASAAEEIEGMAEEVEGAA